MPLPLQDQREETFPAPGDAFSCGEVLGHLTPSTAQMIEAKCVSGLRLLHVAHTTGYGGLERQVLSLCLGLRDVGHSVTLALQPDSWLATQARLEGLAWEPVRFRGLLDPLSHLDVLSMVRRRRIDVVHGHSRRSAFYSALAARLGGCKSVATIHSLQTWKGFRRNHRMIAVSDAVRDFLVKKGLPVERIERIHNGVENVAAISPDERAEARRGLAISPDSIAVAMVGRMVAHKGHDLLLHALAELGREAASMQVFLIGDPIGDWPKYLGMLGAQLGVDAQVRMLGYHDEVKPLLHAMDVFVQPSRSEALSLSLLEAMAVGLPVIAARTGGMPEVVQHDHNGLLFAAGDPQDLARQLARLRNSDERQRLGLSARGSQQQGFTTSEMVTATESLYRKLTRIEP